MIAWMRAPPPGTKGRASTRCGLEASRTGRGVTFSFDSLIRSLRGWLRTYPILARRRALSRAGVSAMIDAVREAVLVTATRSPKLMYVTFLAGTAALGGFLFGFDSAVINGAVSGLQRGFGSSSAATGFAVASILLGCAAGALVAGRLADRLGRRFVMIASAILFVITSLWAGGAASATTFTIARGWSGIAVGASSVVCP